MHFSLKAEASIMHDQTCSILSVQSKPPERLTILGIPVDLYTPATFLAFLIAAASGERKTSVGYVNVHELVLAHDIPEHRHFLCRADAVFLDGFGALLGAKMLGLKAGRKHRMTGPDFLEPLILACEEHNLSLYLLGGEPPVLLEAIRRFRQVAPRLKVHGHHGFFEKRGPENDVVIGDINLQRPDILYVGFGSPLQEQWISDNLNRINARVFLPMGAGLDHYTGARYRGPRWATDFGMEWLVRLFVEPRRLWKRYLLGNLRFFTWIIAQRLARSSTS